MLIGGWENLFCANELRITVKKMNMNKDAFFIMI